MYKTADLMDRFAHFARSCPVQFRDFGARSSFHGPVRTLSCLDDNGLLRDRVSRHGDNAVLVVDGHGSLHSALLGDILAEKAARNCWAGIIVFGAVRDAEALSRVDIGVKALGVNPARSSKRGSGESDTPIVIGNLRFAAGDWVYCDSDGVVLAPTAIHEELERA